MTVYDVFRMLIDIIGATDGSGKYDTLKRVEENSANLKNVSVLPADVWITAKDIHKGREL